MTKVRPKVLGEWRDNAACIGRKTEMFYPEKSQAQACRAKCVCSMCPVKDKCLDEAIANGERFGIWGGKDTQERKKIARERRKAGLLTEKTDL